MILAHILRGVAWAIALAALVDPVLTLERTAPIALQVVTVRTPSLDLPAALNGGTRGHALADAIASLEARLGSQYHMRHVEAGGGVPVDWCAGADACLVAGDDTAAPAGTSVSVPHVALVARAELTPNVAVRDVRASSTQHSEALGSILVSLEGRGVEGRRTLVRILDNGRVRGEGAHEWAAAEVAADVTVQWWPVEAGVRSLTVEAVPFEGEASALDNQITLAVDVSPGRLPVLVYEPRPSWASTFVRRALEHDPRLRVDARSRVAPRTAVTTRDAPALTPSGLEDVALVVVGGLDELSQADVALLRVYVERRGGSLLLLPDRIPASGHAGLVPGRLRERLVAVPIQAGPLRATELALTVSPEPVDRVLAALDDGTAAVVESPVGRGRIVVSGAMDAWRHRGAGDGFDEFWQRLAARLAAEAGPSLDVQPRAASIAAGDAVTFEVAWRTLSEDAANWPALTAWLTCEGGGQQPLTVWPDAAAGTYRVVAAPRTPGRCAVEVAPASRPDLAQSALVEVVEGLVPPAPHQPGALSRLARSRGGDAFDTGRVDELAAAVRAAVAPRLEPDEVRPLQAPWWLVLLAGALGGEWWFRRKRGLR